MVSDDAEKLIVNHRGNVRTFNRAFPAVQSFRVATDEEASQIKLYSWVLSHPKGHFVGLMLEEVAQGSRRRWGLSTIADAPRTSHWNYTCNCRSLLKIHHRFSVFVEQMRKACDLNLETVALDSGRFKTVLHPGSYKENKHKYMKKGGRTMSNALALNLTGA